MLIHFLNHQVLNLHGLLDRFPPRRLGHAVERSLVAAVLVSDTPLIIPTVDIVQSPATQHIAPTLTTLARHDHLNIVGSTTSIDELVLRKRAHFQGTGYHDEWLGSDPHEVLLPFRGALSIRQGDTTYDMLSAWSKDVNRISRKGKCGGGERRAFPARQLEQALHLLPGVNSRSQYLDAAFDLPDKLGGHAFLWNVVERISAFGHSTAGPSHRSFERTLAYYWVMSHIDEYQQPIIARDNDLGMIDCGLRYEKSKHMFDMADFRVFLRKLGLERLLASPVDDVCAYKQDPRILMLLSHVLKPCFAMCRTANGERSKSQQDMRAIAAISLRISAQERTWSRALPRIASSLLELDGTFGRIHRRTPPPFPHPAPQKRSATVTDVTIFIGHGRSPAWLSLRDLIRDRLCLDWEEFDRSPPAGKTVSQRLGEMLSSADFAFLVLTAEDEQADGRVQARQNVVHELGLFQGRLGFDRAIALIEEGCDEFANLAGLVQIRFPKGNLMAVSEEIRRVLEDRFQRRIGITLGWAR